jgi:hypothetical protein
VRRSIVDVKFSRLISFAKFLSILQLALKIKAVDEINFRDKIFEINFAKFLQFCNLAL